MKPVGNDSSLHPRDNPRMFKVNAKWSGIHPTRGNLPASQHNNWSPVNLLIVMPQLWGFCWPLQNRKSTHLCPLSLAFSLEGQGSHFHISAKRNSLPILLCTLFPLCCRRTRSRVLSEHRAGLRHWSQGSTADLHQLRICSSNSPERDPSSAPLIHLASCLLIRYHRQFTAAGSYTLWPLAHASGHKAHSFFPLHRFVLTLPSRFLMHLLQHALSLLSGRSAFRPVSPEVLFRHPFLF